MSAKIKINNWDSRSHSLHELALLPRKIPSGVSSSEVDLSTPLTKYERGGEPEFKLDLPMISATMQSVTGSKMAIALGELGGTGVIFCSQPIDEEVRMVREVNEYKIENRKEFVVSAAINTHDYDKRVPALVEAEVDVLFIDTSQAHNDYAGSCLDFVTKKFEAPIICGNIVLDEGFDFLASHGAHGVKVGMSSGSICTTKEQNGIGRGQATAVYEVANTRDKWYEDHGEYIPIISDGGVWLAKHVSIALALGADSVMVGKYVVGTDESNSEMIENDDGLKVKPYWGEGSAKAKEWAEERYGRAWMKERYGHASFEEGIEIKVPYVGPLDEYMKKRIPKIKDGIRKAGAANIEELHENARLELISTYMLFKGMEKSLIAEMYRS